MITRSALQIMIELARIVRVPEADVAQGKAAPGLVDTQAEEIPNSPTLMIISSGVAPPADAYVAVQYNGRWFWLAATDIRSKYTFGSLMLLLSSISGTGSKGTAPVVTVPRTSEYRHPRESI
jgi:hypothetical protein